MTERVECPVKSRNRKRKTIVCIKKIEDVQEEEKVKIKKYYKVKN